ncbi:MAG: phenylalanine--tRNA ligase subunit beta [Desulfovibrio sp.]|nr:phenylalanine--tRNA ligase subunit beta [Desulfovibrio sp.]
MLLSLSWLREFTPYEGTAQALGDRLTMLGLELEEITHPFEHLKGVTTGHVVTCAMHPDSDHLHCCTVDVGGEALLDIVCGAPNVAAGQKVAVATIGTRLPDGTVIKKSKLRGQTSMGMICSERELGLSEDHTGIMLLPEDTPVGKSLFDVLGAESDVLDIAITPNRADCLSVLGLARETAMAFHLPLTIPERECPIAFSGEPVPIDIQAPEQCSLYAGRIVTDLTIAPSPLAIRMRLQACGIRPISNVVDVTNYILLECGQPLHAFDLDTLAGRKIVVRMAKEGERLTTLDGQERVLTPKDLCICDAKQAVALAGVMGGLASEITAKTRTVFCESAVFHPGCIRKTARRLGLSSEASFRFERGIDQMRSIWALERACAMLVALGGGKADSHVNSVETHAFVPQTISFHPKKAEALLGIALENDFCFDVLTGIGCDWDASGATVGDEVTEITVEQPSWRPDITREADLIEEVGRVYGLDRIPPAMPAITASIGEMGIPKADFSFGLRLKHWAMGLGLHECINYSFVGENDLDRLGVPAEDRIAIMNPLSAEQSVLRTSLAPGLLLSLKTNCAQNAPSIRLFEVANVFCKDAQSETGASEHNRLGILLSGLRHDLVWPYQEEELGYSDMRGIVEHLCHFLHLEAPSVEQVEEHPYYAPAVAVRLGGEPLGMMGRVRPEIAEVFLANKAVWLCELDCAALMRLAHAAKPAFSDLPIYPQVRRDITVIGDSHLTVGRVHEAIVKTSSPNLVDIAFVSLYEPEGRDDKHLSFRLTFRHPKRTLKDSEVDKERARIAEQLVASLGVRV